MAQHTLTVCVLLAAVAVCSAERVYYLTDVGLHSIYANATDDKLHAKWDANTDECRTGSRGLGIDEIEMWATVSCGSRFFKVRFSQTDTFTEVSFGNTKTGLFYGTAINTDTHTAYVASFEVGTFTGWVVRGHYLPGCDTITDETKCFSLGPCTFSSASKACKAKTTYSYMKVLADEPIGGGLFADEENIMWLSYETHEHGGDSGGYVESKQGGKLISYPHVHEQFPAKNYGKQEIGYPMLIDNHLYVQSLTLTGVDLYSFDKSADPAILVHDKIPPFKGYNLQKTSKVRQPAFAMYDTHTVLYVSGSAILKEKCSKFPCDDSSEELVRASNMGPMFYTGSYRELPVPKTPVPTIAPTDAPETPQPTDMPTTAAPTDAPATPKPATSTDTPAPAQTASPPGVTDVPDGQTAMPGGAVLATLQPGMTPLPGSVSVSAPGDDDDGVLMWVLLGVVGALCLTCGILVGCYCKKGGDAAAVGHHSMVEPEHQELDQKIIGRGPPSSPESLPRDSGPSFCGAPICGPQDTLPSLESGFCGAPIGGPQDRNFSADSGLIQTCELTVANCRQPAGDVRFPSQHSGQWSGQWEDPYQGGRGRPTSPATAGGRSPTASGRRRSVAFGRIGNTPSASLNSGDYSRVSLHNTLSGLDNAYPGTVGLARRDTSAISSRDYVALSPTQSHSSHAMPGTPTSHQPPHRPRERLRSVADRANVKGALNNTLVLSV